MKNEYRTSIAILVGVSIETSPWPCLAAISAQINAVSCTVRQCFMHEGEKLVCCERMRAICNNEYREYSRDVCPRETYLQEKPLCRHLHKHHLFAPQAYLVLRKPKTKIVQRFEVLWILKQHILKDESSYHCVWIIAWLV